MVTEATLTMKTLRIITRRQHVHAPDSALPPENVGSRLRAVYAGSLKRTPSHHGDTAGKILEMAIDASLGSCKLSTLNDVMHPRRRRRHRQWGLTLGGGNGCSTQS